MTDIETSVMSKKPLIAIDLDDVIFDCNATLQVIILNEFGFVGTYSDFLNVHPNKVNTAFEFLYGEYHKNGSAVPGALKAISKIASSYEVIIITSRSETVKPQTMEWLDSKLPRDISRVYFTNNFLPALGDIPRENHDICIDLGIRTIIEDSYDVAMGAVLHGVSVLLMDKPWNRKVPEHPSICRVKSCRDVSDFLSKSD
jgi:uncharacterized HAD superfamily protein